eukprot:913988-Pleurochrysis_carterae.AAC.1
MPKVTAPLPLASVARPMLAREKPVCVQRAAGPRTVARSRPCRRAQTRVIAEARGLRTAAAATVTVASTLAR